MPDDLQVYGFLTDANIELGRYKEAEEACQWMLDLRPGNIAAFTRAAYLREIFGDIEGAIELMRQAYDRTLPSEVEDRAWMLTHLGHLELVAGRVANADLILAEALKLFPDYHYALASLAKVRTAQGRLAEAATILEKHVAGAPHPENYFGLAEALRNAGREPEARARVRRFRSQGSPGDARLGQRQSRTDLLLRRAGEEAGRGAEDCRNGDGQAPGRDDPRRLCVGPVGQQSPGRSQGGHRPRPDRRGPRAGHARASQAHRERVRSHVGSSDPLARPNDALRQLVGDGVDGLTRRYRPACVMVAACPAMVTSVDLCSPEFAGMKSST